jgi:activator of HSP90 ATPase
MREKANKFTRRQAIVGASLAACGLALTTIKSGTSAAATEEVLHTAEAIHQEVAFNASPARVYHALLDTAQFDKVIQLGAAVKSGMALGNKPTQINSAPGGKFTIFGGHIVGRQIELAPNQRIVQAWRVIDWNPGIYSIVRFALTEQGSGAKLVFDHTGFPQGQAQHLADGWHENYWEPLAKFLA